MQSSSHGEWFNIFRGGMSSSRAQAIVARVWTSLPVHPRSRCFTQKMKKSLPSWILPTKWMPKTTENEDNIAVPYPMENVAFSSKSTAIARIVDAVNYPTCRTISRLGRMISRQTIRLVFPYRSALPLANYLPAAAREAQITPSRLVTILDQILPSKSQETWGLTRDVSIELQRF